MQVHSLTSAMHTAASGMNRVAQRLDTVAHEVANGFATDASQSTGNPAAAVVELSELQTSARANAAVIRTSSQLLEQLYTNRRM